MEDHLITLEEIQSTVTKINKKIILVNSSKYTDDAFEYLLDIIDECETIAFIINERKIYTHGEYFGGDLWEDTLNYFHKYNVLNEEDEIVSQIFAQSSKDTIQFKGEDGVTLYSDYDIHREASTLHIKYNIENAVDKSSFVKVSDENIISLNVDNNKIKLSEYVPVSVKFQDVPIVEYDSGDIQINVSVNISDQERLKSLEFETSNDTTTAYDWETGMLSVSVPNNTSITIYANYADENVSSTSSTNVEWGYIYAYGDSLINYSNIDEHTTGLASKFDEISIKLDIGENKHGWFAYPCDTPIDFVDITNGLHGGWRKHSQFRKYEFGILYQVWCTEQTGLGSTSWKIVEKQ